MRAPARDREPASVAWEADVREPSVAREVRQLRARNVRERTAAARALATMGPRAKEAVPAPLAAMARRSSGIEFEMAVDRTLRAIGAAAVPDLVDALRDGDAERRFYAARALMKIGPAAAEAVPALVHTLENDPDYGVRANAAAALGDMGPRAAPAVPALRRAAGNPRAPITHDTAQGQLRVRAQMALDRIERPPPPP